ncbi:hypothetical protein ACFQ9X_18870 [Catenulispora yoronensis]
MLKILGVGETGERIYRTLLGVASATAGELAELMSTRLDVVEREVTALTALGLVSAGDAKPRRFSAAPPDVTLESLVLRRQAELAEVRGELAGLARTYRDARRVQSSDEVIEIVVGAEALTERVLHMNRTARFQHLGFVKPPFQAIGLEDTEALTNPEVAYRTVFDREVMAYPDFLRALRAGVGPDDQVRLHPALPMKMVITDRSTALLPLVNDPAAGPSAVVVRGGGLLDALVALFDHYWAASVPLPLDDRGRGRPGPSPDDLRILTLLLAGATDAAVARQLDVSVRTVQRRVTEMMAEAGVSTRIQLGWHAARNGWL